MENAYRSKRLLYKAIELPEDEDYFLARQADPQAIANSYSGLLRPANKATVEDIKKYYETCLLAVIICLPPTAAGEEGDKPTRIGEITLSGIPPQFAHHRHADVGIGLLAEYRNQGYGSEAIEWVLEWGFNLAGLHRIGIGASGWNTGAWALYERLGFVLESRKREHIWYNGGFQDLVELGMLNHEWRARRDKKIAGNGSG